jgi:GINS complex subunit 4
MSSPSDPFLTTTTSSQETAVISPDYTSLTRAWINERRSPDLLPYEATMVENIMKLLRPQWTLISARQAQWTGRDSHIRDLLTMEADRVGYMLKAYLRVRLLKIQKYARYYLMSGQSLMSPSEVAFATNVLGITEEAFKSMFLRHLPQGDEYFQSLVASDDPGGDMIRRPNLERVVFIKATETVGPVKDGNSSETVTFEKGRNYIARYDLIREYVGENRISLI